MPTPRFRDLTPEAAVSVVDAFLWEASPLEFTEKLAGQHLTAVVRPDGTIRYSIKRGSEGSGGYFPDVERVLNSHHPPIDAPLKYHFEILQRDRRPDYIDYPLSSDVTVVEFGGEMKASTARALNSAQDRVRFMTRDEIHKSLHGVINDPSIRGRLLAFRELASKGRVPKASMIEIEEILMDQIDSGRIPSTFGGSRMEGLFGSSPTVGVFKIPSRSYVDVQRRQSKFYAMVRSGKSSKMPGRFTAAVDDPSGDQAVADVLEYIDYVSSTGIPAGFKVFFSPSEMRDLKSLADEYRSGSASAGDSLARKFFTRVKSRKDWVSSSLKESLRDNQRISLDNRKRISVEQYQSNTLRLIRSYVRMCIIKE